MSLDAGVGSLEPITDEEQQRLVGLEEVIEAGLVSFVAVGTALAEVRDDRLYRESHPSFEAYCDERFGIVRSRAYQMIEAAEVVSTMVDTGAPAPENERQARALAAAPVEERADVMAAVAGKGKLTAKAIEDEAKSRRPPSAPCRSCGAMRAIATTTVDGRVYAGLTDGECVACRVSRPKVQPEPEPAQPVRGSCSECGWSLPIFCSTAPVCHACAQAKSAPPLPTGKPVEAEHLAEAEVAAEFSKPKPAPKPPTLRDAPESQEAERLWRPVRMMAKALVLMPTVAEVVDTLPPDSVDEFDRTAAALAKWAADWTEARKATAGLRLVGGTR